MIFSTNKIAHLVWAILLDFSNERVHIRLYGYTYNISNSITSFSINLGHWLEGLGSLARCSQRGKGLVYCASVGKHFGYTRNSVYLYIFTKRYQVRITIVRSGVWRSWLARSVRDAEVGSSSLLTPTT